MADRDTIRSTLKGAWRKCLPFVPSGADSLAKALHHAVINSEAARQGLGALASLSRQLPDAIALGWKGNGLLSLPPEHKGNRASHAALRAAHRVVAICAERQRGTSDAEANQLLAQQYFIEIIDMCFLGVLQSGALNVYLPPGEEMGHFIEDTRRKLLHELEHSAMALCNRWSISDVPRAPKPLRQKKTQSDVLEIEIPVRL